MPDWHGIVEEIRKEPESHEKVRRAHLARLHKITKRNIILYYSGWLQNSPSQRGVMVDNSDKNGFMSMLFKWSSKQRTKGLDLVLHTPGGDIAAAESLGYYLREKFGDEIRVIVPQLAMSAGTMLACLGRTIVMGQHSCLGPTDPQIGGVSASDVVVEFAKATQEIKKNPVWHSVIAGYPPGFTQTCEHAVELSKIIVSNWLGSGMFKDNELEAKRIAKWLCSSKYTKTHSRQLTPRGAKNTGLKVEMLEDDEDAQDAVLSVHHACMWAFAQTRALKIIENHDGVSFVQYKD